MHKATCFMAVLISSALWILPLAPQAQTAPGGPAEMPPARAIPGISAEDQFPNACVDCHINYADMNLDKRFRTLMAKWAEKVDSAVLEIARDVGGPGVKLMGVHPRVDAALHDIPAACFSCHQSGASGVPLAPLLHKIHVGGGNDAVFLRVFQGECTHCHKFDRTTGQWRVPSGPEK